MASMVRAVVLLAVAGCYTASPARGVPCDPAEPRCPAGQMCVPRGGDFVCDSEPGDVTIDGSLIDASSANDLDGDGVANAADNCPMKANANQANEDGDTQGDACDNCPPFPSMGADADGDGVGDVCDPHLLIPGDSIALFEGFAGGAIPQGWVATGTWSVQQGTLIVTTADNELDTLVVPYAHTQNQTISTFATIAALAGSLGGSIGIVDRFDGAEGIVCGGGRAGGDLFGLINASSGVFLNSKPHPFEVGTLYRITMTRTDKTYGCTTVQTNGDTVETSATFDNAAGPNIGFRIRTASAAYPWIMVVKSP